MNASSILKSIEINENARLLVFTYENKTAIYLMSNGERVLSLEAKTDEHFSLKYVLNGDYVLIYSRGDATNNRPLNIEGVYDIAKEGIVPLTIDNREFFEYMLIEKRGFDTAVVLQLLNKADLKIASPEEVGDFINYITAKSKDISYQEMEAYVIATYPLLKEYKNLTPNLSVPQYRKIINRIGTDKMWFHIMPQIIDPN